jgi:glucose-1-phosphate cytidylyltransferase
VKVVLFCGGLGTRLKAYSDTIPKPMVPVGTRPILWHLMRYYAHYGHTEFILCLGYRGDVIRQYFHDELAATPAGEVRPEDGGASWRVTFVDTGPTANIGQRLKAAAVHLGDDPMFLANYSDGLSNIDLRAYLEFFAHRDKLAAFVSVRPHHSFHVVDLDDDGAVVALRGAGDSGLRINGGFFVFKRGVLAYLGEGEDLVEEPFRRLIAVGELSAYRHDGFWHSMDTFKDKQTFDDMVAQGVTPWEVWRTGAAC